MLYNSIVGASISSRGPDGIIYDTRSSGYSKYQGSDKWSSFMRVIFRDFARKKLKTGQEFPKQHTVSHGGPTGNPFYYFEGDWNGSFPTSSSSSMIFVLLLSRGTLLFLAFRNKFPRVFLVYLCTFQNWHSDVHFFYDVKLKLGGSKKKSDFSALSLWSWSFIFFVVWIRWHSCVSDLCICLRIVYTKLSSANETCIEISLPSEPSLHTWPLPIKCLILAACAGLWMNWRAELAQTDNQLQLSALHSNHWDFSQCTSLRYDRINAVTDIHSCKCNMRRSSTSSADSELTYFLHWNT